MHIIVTGASGFVARELMRACAADGSTGLAVSRRPVDDLPRGWMHQNRAAFLAEGAAAGVDAIVHLEVLHHRFKVGESAQDAQRAFDEVNVEGTRTWLDWGSAKGVTRFLYFSSSKAVDHTKADGPAVDETVPGPGPTPYGKSKWAAEGLVRAWGAARDRSAVIVRPCVIYGPGNVANIYSMLDAVARRRFLYVGRNDNIKALVSITNAVAAALHLLHRAAPGCDTYNLVDADRISVRQLGDAMARHLGAPPPALAMPLSVASLLATAMDLAGKATGRRPPLSRDQLHALVEHADFSPQKLIASGFTHPETVDEGIRRMAVWYRAQQRGDGA